MSCPICNNTKFSEGAENCPECGSDLEVFTHIESAQKERQSQKKSIIILAILLGVVVVSWVFSGDKPHVKEDAEAVNTEEPTIDSSLSSPEAASKESEEALKKENENLKSEVAALTSEVNKLKKPMPSAKVVASEEKGKAATSDVSNESNVIIHVVKRGESLWRISMKYYKNGSKAQKIAADNNITNLKAIRIGAKLKIYK